MLKIRGPLEQTADCWTPTSLQGIAGLYKGIIPNLAKVAPAAGISWVVFEEVKLFLGVDPKTWGWGEIEISTEMHKVLFSIARPRVCGRCTCSACSIMVSARSLPSNEKHLNSISTPDAGYWATIDICVAWPDVRKRPWVASPTKTRCLDVHVMASLHWFSCRRKMQDMHPLSLIPDATHKKLAWNVINVCDRSNVWFHPASNIWNSNNSSGPFKLMQERLRI